MLARGIRVYGLGVTRRAFALSKTPFDVLRGTGGEEKVLKNAKDACATEALEIATYTALERLAIKVGDERTAQLARSIRSDEERMLERIMREIPKLTDTAIGADVNGEPYYDIMETGAADAARELAHEVKQTARDTQTRARRTARQARKVPGVVQVEGQIKGAVASEEDLAIPGYDSLTAEEIVSKLPELSQIDLAKIGSYERTHDNRTTVLSASPRCGVRSRGPGITSSRSRRSKQSSARATSGMRRTSLRTSGPTRTAPACSGAQSARPPTSELRSCPDARTEPHKLPSAHRRRCSRMTAPGPRRCAQMTPLGAAQADRTVLQLSEPAQQRWKRLRRLLVDRIVGFRLRCVAQLCDRSVQDARDLHL